MSFPKLSECIGKGNNKLEYKRVSLIHSIKNSLTRNTIIQSCAIKTTPKSGPFQFTQKINPTHGSLSKFQISSSFRHVQRLPTSLDFSTEDMYKLLGHLFNKKEHDSSDRNFIRRLLLKYFPEELVCAGGRDFITQLKFHTLRKGQSKLLNFGQSSIHSKRSNVDGQNNEEKCFYFVLKGKVTVFTSDFTFKKSSGEYFGQLQILGGQNILDIQAKTDVMLLTLSEEEFHKYMGHFFVSKFSQIRKKVSLFEPLMNQVSNYSQLRMMELFDEKDFKTGDKVIQKGQEIAQITFLNHAQMSFSQDRILNQFKAVGLSEFITMENPKAKQTIYCMENKTVYSIKLTDLRTFFQKDIIVNYLTSKFSNLSTLSASKLVASRNERTISNGNSVKLQSFIEVKKVKFMGNKRRVLTEPNSSVLMSSPKSSKKNNCYPQYAASFVFIKQNSSPYMTQLKSNRLRSIHQETSKHKQMKEWMLRTRNMHRKKKWLDEIDGCANQNSIICNPQRLSKYQTPLNQTKQLTQFKQS